MNMRLHRMTQRCVPRRAFTLVELLVAMGMLVVAIVSVAQIFTISSSAAGKTAAHANMLEASSSLRERISADLSKITPGLLIIDCPPPTTVRAEVPGGEQIFRLRHDRIAFIASGSENEFQSLTHRWNSTAIGEDKSAPTSSQALIYIGPGLPVDREEQARDFETDTTLTATEWMLSRRAILLMSQIPTDTDPTWQPVPMATVNGGMLIGGPLEDVFLRGLSDAVISSPGQPATASTIINRIRSMTTASLLTANPAIQALWQPSWSPVSASVGDSSLGDYYTRGCFTLQPRLADFRIEWTDGRRVNPNDPNPVNQNFNTRWFGLRPNPTVAPDISDPSALDAFPYVPEVRQSAVGDTVVCDNLAFANGIEWYSAPGPDSHYRAIWRTDTWQYRPKALRFTYRLYDSGRTLKQQSNLDLNEDGLPDVDNAGVPYTVMRFGEEFSMVVPLP